MKKIVERVILTSVLLIVFIWGGYHFVQFKNTDIRTETVLEYTTEDTLSGSGVAIREEQLLPQSQPGRINYLYSDATRVAVDKPIAEYYGNHVNDSSLLRMRELEEEIDRLSQAQNKNINNYTTSGLINRDLRDHLSTLQWMDSTQRYTAIDKSYQEITFLLNRRQVATSKVNDYEDRIAMLSTEYATLKQQTSAQGINTVPAPVAGFFSKSVDGLETRLTPDTAEHLTIAQVNDYLLQPVEAPSGYVGKIVTNHRWNMAVLLPTREVEYMKEGRSVSLLIDYVEKPLPAIISDIHVEPESSEALVLLSCEVMTEDVINLRQVMVDLSFGRYTGLRIDREALRFQTNESGESVRGVYILENHQVKFKKVDPIYENADFVLSRMNLSSGGESDYVRLFDQVITQGTFHEGEIIQ